MISPTAGTAGDSPAPAGETWWHSRLYLPHFEQPGAVQMITFHLADSLPAPVLTELEHELSHRTDAARRRRTEAYLDAGHGTCDLRDVRIAQVVLSTLMRFDGSRYRLLAWVLMPNHAHILIETMPGYSLSEIVHSWKSYTAKQTNELLGRTGTFWHPEYFDRVIRDEAHYAAAVRYIHENPVKAGLVDQAGDWPFSSAARRTWAGESPAVPASRSRRNRAGEATTVPGSAPHQVDTAEATH